MKKTLSVYGVAYLALLVYVLGLLYVYPCLLFYFGREKLLRLKPTP